MKDPSHKKNRPQEKGAVRTTIVGGRPPGSGRGHGEIPRGLEILLKKAHVDPDRAKKNFRSDVSYDCSGVSCRHTEGR